MDILEGNYNHPRIAYQTRTTNPPGTAIFHDRLLVSPNYNEALGLFGLLEGDGVYLWDAHGTSDGDPDGIFQTLKYCVDYKDDRGEWRPDVPGTPLGKAKTWYPPSMAYAADYYALGAWKYAQIADVVTGGRRVDFEYSTDGGKTWYVPPANGGAMADVVRDKRPIVTGAVRGQDVAVVVFHPFQGVADTHAAAGPSRKGRVFVGHLRHAGPRLSRPPGGRITGGLADENSVQRPLSFVVLCGAAVGSVRAADDAPELVRNPRFEAAEKQDLPDGWTVWKPVCEEASCTVRATKEGLKIDAPQKPFAVGGVWQDLQGIAGGQAYAFDATCKAENIASPYRSLIVRVLGPRRASRCTRPG